MKKYTYLLLGLTIISAFYAVFPQVFLRYTAGKFFCRSDSQFHDDTSQIATPAGNIINPSGTVKYYRDNFDAYSQDSKTIDQFEDLSNLKLTSPLSELKLSNSSISGQNSLLLKLISNNLTPDQVIIKKELERPIDLSRWNYSGILSMWLNLQDRKGISGINLKIGDKDNNYREFSKISNLLTDIPNNYDTDDIYPDIELPNINEPPSIWTDFWLNNGWNYLFWQSDPTHYHDQGSLDTKNISWYEISLTPNKEISDQGILFDDFRISDGIQKEHNSLGDNWYPPDNDPQNGIFDLDSLGNGDFIAKLLNVRHTQYPTNGDHGRMVLKYGTPINFAMRARFKLTNFPKNKTERVNTWFRVAYDFDSSYDPGHDWFGTFISFEWNKFGLTMVIPIEKDNVQEWEPKRDNTIGSSVNFTPREDVLYEVHLTARGQKATASIYEVGNNCLLFKGQTDYEFQRPRHGEDSRYPFCLEVTGNVKAYIYDFEIKEL